MKLGVGRSEPRSTRRAGSEVGARSARGTGGAARPGRACAARAVPSSSHSDRLVGTRAQRPRDARPGVRSRSASVRRRVSDARRHAPPSPPRTPPRAPAGGGTGLGADLEQVLAVGRLRRVPGDVEAARRPPQSAASPVGSAAASRISCRVDSGRWTSQAMGQRGHAAACCCSAPAVDGSGETTTRQNRIALTDGSVKNFSNILLSCGLIHRRPGGLQPDWRSILTQVRLRSCRGRGLARPPRTFLRWLPQWHERDRLQRVLDPAPRSRREVAKRSPTRAGGTVRDQSCDRSVLTGV